MFEKSSGQDAREIDLLLQQKTAEFSKLDSWTQSLIMKLIAIGAFEGALSFEYYDSMEPDERMVMMAYLEAKAAHERTIEEKQRMDAEANRARAASSGSRF